MAGLVAITGVWTNRATLASEEADAAEEGFDDTTAMAGLVAMTGAGAGATLMSKSLTLEATLTGATPMLAFN